MKMRLKPHHGLTNRFLGDIMKKDIYVIKNDVNDLVYVGQSVNAKRRWAGHCSNARHMSKFNLIDYAMHSIGIEHFNMSIIERVENYNERERYWIKELNSRHPNGYNFCGGGEQYYGGVEAANSIIKDEQILKKIISDIKHTNVSFREIAKKYGVSSKILTSINRGGAYYSDDIEYPIRKRNSDANHEDKVMQIIYDIKNTKLSLRDIGEKYEVSEHVIRCINKGTKYRVENEAYPIRKGKITDMNISLEKTLLIIEDLKDKNKSFRSIYKKHHISNICLYKINSGKICRQNKIEYPIREISTKY